MMQDSIDAVADDAVADDADADWDVDGTDTAEDMMYAVQAAAEASSLTLVEASSSATQVEVSYAVVMAEGSSDDD